MVDLSESELRRDLYQLNLTQKEVAEKHDCSRMTVSRRMKKYGLESLPKLRVKENAKNRKYYISGQGNRFAEYQLVAIADGADPHDVFGESHIHHINGCKYDDRPQNLIVLTPEEHGIVEKGDFEIDKEHGIMYKTLELS